MGNRRMISKTVTQTQRFLQMPLEAQALYFHLIQNSDDDGVVEAFPVVRMIGASDDSLGLLVIKHFIKPLNDEMVYFVVDFHEQNSIQKHHYKPSRYQELLTDEEIAKNPRILKVIEHEESKINQGQQDDNQMLTSGYPNISKVKVSKDNISKGSSNTVENQSTTTPPPPLNQNLAVLCKTFEQEFGRMLSPLQIEEVSYMLDDFSLDLIQEALREAVSQGKANFSYIKAILNRWKSDNLLTVELVRNSRKSRTKTETKQPTSFDDWRPTADEPF